MATHEGKPTPGRKQSRDIQATRSRTGYKRVYTKNGSYYYVDPAGKWHRLGRVEHGEAAMLRSLAKFKRAGPYPAESVAGLIDAFRSERLTVYAEYTQRDYGRMLIKIRAAFNNRMVADITSPDVMDLRDQWKLTPRSSNKYHALLSVLMSFAIERRLISTNPCREVAKYRIKRRKHYMTDTTLDAIRQASGEYTVGKSTGRPPSSVLSDEQVAAIRTDTRPWHMTATELGVNRSTIYRVKNGTYRAGGSGVRRCPNGQMYACLFDLAYLTALRAKDCRELKWSDIAADFIYVRPTKTQSSSGTTLEIEITAAIRAVLDRAKSIANVENPANVFHTLKGALLTASALKSAWQRARKRAGIQGGDRFRDLRPKALSDAKRRGLSLEALRDAAGHASVSTTEDYMRGFETKRVNLCLDSPPAGQKPRNG